MLLNNIELDVKTSVLRNRKRRRGLRRSWEQHPDMLAG